VLDAVENMNRKARICLVEESRDLGGGSDGQRPPPPVGPGSQRRGPAHSDAVEGTDLPDDLAVQATISRETPWVIPLC
jgi:hypothetical protein